MNSYKKINKEQEDLFPTIKEPLKRKASRIKEEIQTLQSTSSDPQIISQKQ